MSLDTLSLDGLSLDGLKDLIPEFARDVRLNLGSVLSTQGAPGLSERQIWSIALASAIASRNDALTRHIELLARAKLDEAALNGARAAVAIMSMNNVYYRFTHLVEDAEYRTLPARLRMNVIANPGIDRNEFELLSLAVSAINACGMCITSHERNLREHGVTREAIQSAVRIASVIHATAVTLEYSQSLEPQRAAA